MSNYFRTQALILISDIDNIVYQLSSQGYFGRSLKKETEKIKEIRLVDDSNFIVPFVGIPVRLFVLLSIFAGMIAGWSFFIEGQSSRRFFIKEHPQCNVDEVDDYYDYYYHYGPHYIKDGRCHSMYNTSECGYDGGDCIEFREQYPNCTVETPEWIGDGECNLGQYYTEECGYDGGDDCTAFKKNYPSCNVDYPFWIGDGHCDGKEYNTKECDYDGGDCTQFNKDYPNCTVDVPYQIGDGECDGKEYNNTECGYDGGDCLG